MIAPARRIAYRILFHVATTDAHSDDLLRSAEVDALSAQDRALATTLVLGTLRWQLALDAQVQALLARPEARLSAEAAVALQMGAYQLLHLDRVPAHAVIHDAVELVKEGKERGAAGMVNAVLRRVGRPGGGDSRGIDPAVGAHRAWMVQRWVRRYGVEAAEAICRWDQEPAAATLRVMQGFEPADLETEAGYFLTSARRVIRGDAAGSSASVRRFRVQDEASQLVAEVAAGAVEGAVRVLDLCAAPGGKTAVLAERLPQAEITAVDISRKRLESMVLAARAGRFATGGENRLDFLLADATKMELKPEWDLILCDVPCSGTGTMARNPEIRVRVTEADLARQHARQAAILRAGLRGLKAGGRLVYSTCSLEPEENEEVVAEVLRAADGFEVAPIAPMLDQITKSGVVTAQGRARLGSAIERSFLRTIPGMQPCDGFFAAVVERI